MNNPENSGIIIIDNSQIEFIVVGTIDNETRILLKSKNAKLDLLGYAMTASEKYNVDKLSISKLFFKTRTLNIVHSYAIEPIFNPYQAKTEFSEFERKTQISFVWVGLCSELSRKKIEDTFKRYAVDLQRGVINKTLEQIEISISPVILYCIEANERRINSRKSSKLVIILYLGIALLAFLFFLSTRGYNFFFNCQLNL